MILLIDSNSICHRAKHGMRDSGLSFKLMETEIIFSFMKTIGKLAKDFNTGDFIFCWDSIKKKRLEVDSEYKAHRYKDLTVEDIQFNQISFKQFAEIRRIVLPEIGFRNNFIQTGYEADDIIAAICKEHWETEITIISSDSDLYQLLTDYHKMYSMPSMGKAKIITMDDFIKKFGVNPTQWATVKAMWGDTSDNITGLEGVGPATSAKFLKNELPHTHKTYETIMNNQKIIKRNEKLTKLPYPGTITPKLIEDELSLAGIIRICEKYGFKSLIKNEELIKWQEDLNL